MRIVLLALAAVTILALQPLAKSAAPTRVAVVEGFAIPESARYDPTRDQYFVSNVNAHATAADNDGFISLIGPDSEVVERRFIAGGQNGVTLHGPKGMALVGDDLWVTDVTMLRRFNRTTGKPGPVVDLGPHGALFLDDVTAAPDGTLYVSDTSLVFPPTGNPTRGNTDRVYRVTPAGAVYCHRRPAARGTHRRLLEGPRQSPADCVDHGEEHLRLERRRQFAGAGDRPRWLRRRGTAGRHDDSRVEPGPAGADDAHGAGPAPLIPGVSDVADIGVDTKHHRVAIPRLDPNVMEIW